MRKRWESGSKCISHSGEIVFFEERNVTVKLSGSGGRIDRSGVAIAA